MLLLHSCKTVKMSFISISKIIFVVFFFDDVLICKAYNETESTSLGEEVTTKVELPSSSATGTVELGESIRPSNISTMTTMTTPRDEVCAPSEKKKREAPAVSDAEMALAVRLEWERENFYDGEMAEYYEKNSVTEWDLYSFFHDHDVAKGRKREDFTMIKAILQNVTFKQDFKNVESEIYLEIRSQLVSLINSINKITKQSLLSSEVFQMALYKTEDCFVKFILYIPWNKKSSEVGTIGGISLDLSKQILVEKDPLEGIKDEVVDHLNYYGNIANISFVNFALGDFCSNTTEFSVYKCKI